MRSYINYETPTSIDSAQVQSQKHREGLPGIIVAPYRLVGGSGRSAVRTTALETKFLHFDEAARFRAKHSKFCSNMLIRIER